MATFGLPQHSWLQEYPMASIIVANTWRGTAFSMLLYASALEGIPNEMFEAAAIDGAAIWARIRYITLPMIKGAIATDLLLITLATLSDFTLVYVLTGGNSPSSELLTIYQYRQAFQFYQIGYGSAIALLIIAVGAILSLVYLRVLRIEL
jgi:multiple sugar transport system permease protein